MGRQNKVERKERERERNHVNWIAFEHDFGNGLIVKILLKRTDTE